MGDISGTYLYRLKRNAELRDLEFTVTLEHLWELLQKQEFKCALTGLPISVSFKSTAKYTASVDRIDSAKGYVECNVQWVHKDVNKMKLDLSESRFFELCRLVVENGKMETKETIC